jgi:transposase
MDLRETSKEFRQGCDLAQAFAALVRERKGAELNAWMKAAKESGIGELKRFVAGLEKDRSAVQNGLTLSWSNGPTEGFNNRLKEIKRRLYGRANFDLLRRMALQPP